MQPKFQSTPNLISWENRPAPAVSTYEWSFQSTPNLISWENRPSRNHEDGGAGGFNPLPT